MSVYVIKQMMLRVSDIWSFIIKVHTQLMCSQHRHVYCDSNMACALRVHVKWN